MERENIERDKVRYVGRLKAILRGGLWSAGEGG